MLARTFSRRFVAGRQTATTFANLFAFGNLWLHYEDEQRRRQARCQDIATLLSVILSSCLPVVVVVAAVNVMVVIWQLVITFATSCCQKL